MTDLPPEWRKALTSVNGRLKEIFSDVPGRGLEPVVEEIQELLVAVWAIENLGALRHVADDVQVVNRFAQAFPPPMHKIAPPPPKKVKRDTPPRKILPLSEAGAVRGLDAVMLLRALVEIGDYTQQTDKARMAHLLFIDDWRRMIWESAKIVSWDRFRALAAGEPAWAPRVPSTRFSRSAALTLLEAVAKYRADLITPIPSVSMIACQGCGRFEGRERVRCAVCSRLFCGRCLARAAELCMADYAVRYAKIPEEIRLELLRAAREICARFRLDEYTRNVAFARALAEHGVEVVFQDAAPDAGDESVDAKGKIKLRLRDRENATTKKILFAALARCHFRESEKTPDPEHEAYFVDVCLGAPIEEALKSRGGAISDPKSQITNPA